MIEVKKILICYNKPIGFYQNYIGKNIEEGQEKIDLSETEFQKNLNIVENSLKNTFTSVAILGFDRNIKAAIQSIENYHPDVIFNFVESIEGNAKYEIFVTGMFDLLGYQYTGNSSLCLGNCLIKYRTKQLLQFYNINTPKYRILRFSERFSEAEINMHYPLILKLVNEDASIGISEFSVVKDFKSLKKQAKFLFQNYQQDIIAEEYIKGRELNVSILGGEILPISEIKFKGLPSNLPKIVTYEAKWSPNSVYYTYTNPKCPAELNEIQVTRIKNIALEAYKALGCRDYARVDIRLAKNNQPYVIEVNPNPDLSPDAGFIRSASVAGIGYDDLLFKLANLVIDRQKI